MPCCGDNSEALAALEELDSDGSNPVWLLEDVTVDDFWVNFCCNDNVALPFVQLPGHHYAKVGVSPKRRITFVEKPDVETFVIKDCLFSRQTPPSSFLACEAIGRKIIVDDDYIYHSEYSAAVARYKALDLCSAWARDGRKVLPLLPNHYEKDMSCEFVKSSIKEQSCEMPLRVLLWEDDRVLSFVPDRDGYASYGRPTAYWVHEHVLTIELATKCLGARFGRMSIVGKFLLGPLLLSSHYSECDPLP